MSTSSRTAPFPAVAVKNIEFVNRRPGMALDEFRTYWRNFHGPLAAKIPSISRYEQNHLALGEYQKDAAPPYDGLAVTWFASTARDESSGGDGGICRDPRRRSAFPARGHLPTIVTREPPPISCALKPALRA